jgi:galactan 5-O-arabinofuranosyltransferase
MRPALVAFGHMLVAALAAGALAAVALFAIAHVQWPAYNSSNQLHALTTVGQFVGVAGLLAAGWVWRRSRPFAAHAVAVVSLAVFSIATLGMPLGATKLYLFGISVDQQFRTEYLTRLTDTAGLHDMTYADLPPYYPAGWFWLGGRAAALTGTPGWEMFKPWAVTSITIAIVMAFILWSKLIRFELAVIVTVATAAATLAYASAEPYAAVITIFLPPVLVLAWSGLQGQSRSGGWAAVVAVGIFLGFAALFYTLLLAYASFTVAIMAAVAAALARKWEPLARLAVVAVIAAAIALIGWLPYLLAAIGRSSAGSGTARHYLPADGAQLPFPMLEFTLLGGLCLLGTLWLVVRGLPLSLFAQAAHRPSTRAAALAFGVVAVYLWSLLSMLATLARTTLLSFRLQPTLTVLLVAAGAFGFVEVAQGLAARRSPQAGRRILVAAGALGLVGALAFSQDIPNVLKSDLVVAYTDTDGNGQRADRRPPGAEKYYAEIDAKIRQVTGKPRDEIVVLTADYSFLSYYPYWGFQGLTSHYANPLAQFDKRAKAIESWSELKTAGEFIAALDKLPWRAPTVFLMRHGANDTFTLRLAADVYPNQPNVRRYQVALYAALFADPRFTVTTIGPFALAIRT